MSFKNPYLSTVLKPLLMSAVLQTPLLPSNFFKYIFLVHISSQKN